MVGAVKREREEKSRFFANNKSRDRGQGEKK